LRRIFLSKPVMGDVNQDIKGRQIHTLVMQKFLRVIFNIMCVGINDLLACCAY